MTITWYQEPKRALIIYRDHVFFHKVDEKELEEMMNDGNFGVHTMTGSIVAENEHYYLVVNDEGDLHDEMQYSGYFVVKKAVVEVIPLVTKLEEVR